MAADLPRLGVGIGWRPEIDLTVERLPGVEFVEVIAESVRPGRIPESLRLLRERGVPVIPHGVALGIGGADKPEISRLEHLAACAEALGAPLVSEHLAFVRGDGLEAGHLLPVPRTRDALAVVTDNLRIAMDVLPVPFALENVAALFAWPDDELTEAQFLGELVERTGVKLLIDVANLYTNEVNQGASARQALDRLPLTELAYVHVAGGHAHGDVWHDTHTASVPEPVLDILTELCARVAPPGVLLEWDDDYPSDAALATELTRIRAAMAKAGT